MKKPVLGISMGDPSGAAPEITLKALAKKEIRAACGCVVVGDYGVMRRAEEIVKTGLFVKRITDFEDAVFADGTVEVIDLANVELDKLEYGKVQAQSGNAAYEAVVYAARLALEKKTDAVVTGALNKEALNAAGHHYAGHTEILADVCGVKSVTMMLSAGDFRVTHVSTHCSLLEAVSRVKAERIYDVILLTRDALLQMGVKAPRIAVAGLNPHAGEGGMFGEEEIKEIAPAVKKAAEAGVTVFGPVAPDTVFHRMALGDFDVVTAMYHDQGHIPTKVLAFDSGVNVTLGLPIIRTSVDHGTAFDKAGRGTADAGSMEAALLLAAKMASERV